MLPQGQFREVQSIGPTCYADDRLHIQLAEEMEMRWRQEQLQQQEQQQEQQQGCKAASAVPMSQAAAAAAVAAAVAADLTGGVAGRQQQQQQQEAEDHRSQEEQQQGASQEVRQQQQQQIQQGRARSGGNWGAGDPTLDRHLGYDRHELSNHHQHLQQQQVFEQQQQQQQQQRQRPWPPPPGVGSILGRRGRGELEDDQQVQHNGVGDGGHMGQLPLAVRPRLQYHQQQQQQVIPAVGGAGVVGVAPPRAALTQQQQQQQQQQAGERQQRGVLGAHPPAAPAAAAAAAGGATGQQDAAAAARGAAPAAVSPAPHHVLIEGIRQRLLSYLVRAIQSGHPSEVATSMEDFHFHFSQLAKFAIWRVQLLDRNTLLLKLGPPSSDPAGTCATAEFSSSRPHIFAVYDIHSSRVLGVFNGHGKSIALLLLQEAGVMMPPGRDATPWERLGGGGLCPKGYTTGLDDQGGLGGVLVDGRAGGMLQAAAAGAVGGARSGGGGGGSGTEGVLALLSGVGGAEGMHGNHLQTAAAAGQRSSGTAGAAGSGEGAGGQLAAAAASSRKAEKERVRWLQQVVLPVLPMLQNLSSSPYLDPHLFRYEKGLSPIIGLRNCSSSSLRFRYARWGGGKPVLALAPAEPHVVRVAGEEVARKMLPLFHPVDPFVLVVVQPVPGQAGAQLQIYHRAYGL